MNRISIRYTIKDTRADVKKRDFENLDLKGKIKSVSIVDSYIVDKKLSESELKKAAAILTNPLIEEYSINSPFEKEHDCFIEVGFLPGVTDNVGTTAQESIEDGLNRFKSDEGVYSLRVFYIFGNLTKKDIHTIANSLYNPLIQRVSINKLDSKSPKVSISYTPKADEVNLHVSDLELEKIGKLGIKNKDNTHRGPLALSVTYLKTIREYFDKKRRNPTDVELEALAQTWSEHCKHTIFADPMDELEDGIFNTYIKGATEIINSPICASVFKDNSGAIVFNDNYLITDKVETHNSPSALDPFGGAVTGIVGVNRDTMGFGLGAKPVINKYGYCFAPPGETEPLFRDKKRKEKMLSPRRILDGVIYGVNVGGNQSGIPTPTGFMFFDKRYKGKPLVFVGTVGLIPKKVGSKKGHEKKARSGDYIVMCGGRVGLDGIHGATFSSEGLTKGSPASAVQIGDPITQKKMSDAIIKEARDMGLYNSITDNGAGGLSSSIGEMARECGGCEVDLSKVLVKYPGLSPWQIWISESQERMTLSIPKSKWKAFSDLMNRRGVETTVIGKFFNSGKCVVKYKGQKVVDMDMDFLHNGRPKIKLKSKWVKKEHKEPAPEDLKKRDLSDDLQEMLSRLNISSFQFISQQYDHEVQGGSVLKPLQGKGLVNADATVTKPVLDSNKGIVLSYGINPTYSDIDTYHMASCAIDTAVRRAVSAGATLKHLALLDNFCWGSSDNPEQLGKLKRAAKACFDISTVYGTPFISGKDSMFNDFKGYDKNGKPIKITVPETLLISSIGVIDHVTRAVSIDTKFPGDLLYALGETFDELGASQYFAMNSYIGNKVPKVDPVKNKRLYQAVEKCVRAGLISSSIAVSLGGLSVALAKMSIAGKLGIDVSLKDLPGKVNSNIQAFFSESQGRIVVAVDPKKKRKFENTMKGSAYALLGKVTKDQRIKIAGIDGKNIIDLKVDKASKSYKSTFKDF